MAAARTRRAGAPVLLVVGGFDPTCGAGVTADCVAAALAGASVRAAVAALTSQDGRREVVVAPVEPGVLAAQMTAALGSAPVRAVKTGALGSAGQVRCVARCLEDVASVPLVVDPVIEASAGGRLLDDAGLEALVDLLLPRAELVTPNLDEAARLAGRDAPCATRGKMVEAARAILDRGPRWVLVTGGHLPAGPADLLAGAGGELVWIEGRRVRTAATHGTGCVLATFAAAALAHGERTPDACETAAARLREALADAPGPDPAPDLLGILRARSGGGSGG
jgi:hydroxymethylpyrimidine/phosphomethylpyrimidine kinase